MTWSPSNTTSWGSGGLNFNIPFWRGHNSTDNSPLPHWKSPDLGLGMWPPRVDAAFTSCGYVEECWLIRWRWNRVESSFINPPKGQCTHVLFTHLHTLLHPASRNRVVHYSQSGLNFHRWWGVVSDCGFFIWFVLFLDTLGKISTWHSCKIIIPRFLPTADSSTQMCVRVCVCMHLGTQIFKILNWNAFS